MPEWWDGPFSVGYYQPYRKIVERQFKKKKKNNIKKEKVNLKYFKLTFYFTFYLVEESAKK